MNGTSEAFLKQLEYQTRRHFLRDCSTGLGAIWLASNLTTNAVADPSGRKSLFQGPTFLPKVRRIIFLHMVGGPSQLELFDYKPDLIKYNGKACPEEYLKDQRFAFIQGIPHLLGHQFAFRQHGESGAWVSDRLPQLAEIADELCFIKTMQTDQFNHGPAQLMVHTGQARVGYASMGSWITWGLGTENENMPGYMVLLSGGRQPRSGNALWASGFLPSVYQGVLCRSSGDPILNVSNPKEVTPEMRRYALDALRTLNTENHESFGDPETLTRIEQYEMAFRMQTAVPEAMNIEDEPEHIQKMYGIEPGKESFANNCLLARRLSERGVRFIQLFDWGWDTHGSTKAESITAGFIDKCRQIDQPITALLKDLKQRGMLDDTLVIWGAEFGRTPMQENRGGVVNPDFVGRDHNPNAFTYWLAGAGVKSGTSFGTTDAMGYYPAESPVHLRDFHATLLHLLGLNHEATSFPFQGLNQKLTGVKEAHVIHEILT